VLRSPLDRLEDAGGLHAEDRGEVLPITAKRRFLDEQPAKW
jgi:hypothetical protein